MLKTETASEGFMLENVRRAFSPDQTDCPWISSLVCYTAVSSVVTQSSSPMWGGALRDDTKNGCVADYLVPDDV